MPRIQLFPFEAFEKLRKSAARDNRVLAAIADMCRANSLAAIKHAGSGHIGSSFSAMDIVVWLYYREMNTLRVGLDSPQRDVYFSSKGHDVPGLYSVLHSVGVISQQKLLMLRRFGGLDGHPDISIPGCEANSGSLGMGISKGKGIAWAKQRAAGGRVFVLCGDGELLEGQNYEALQTCIEQQVTNLTVIIDHNKVQSDKPVNRIVPLGDLETRFAAFGWHVQRCNGHDFAQLENVFGRRPEVDRPKIVIADTIKGAGVSFMEHPASLEADGGIYRWHAGAPDDESFARGHAELVGRVQRRLRDIGLPGAVLFDVSTMSAPRKAAPRDCVADGYGEALIEQARTREDIVVLDADLAADCRVRRFEQEFPDRFIENGIAEQDMVSTAGGLAGQGLLPVVNSFAAFLAARANEQIYNNATEGTKIIYACHYAGLIPAGPGKSHQSIRDIALFGMLPGVVIFQPCCASESRMAVDYFVNQTRENGVLRLLIGPSPGVIELPEDYRLVEGRGVTLCEGTDAVLFGYGPVMLHEALLAAELLRRRGFGLKVVNMPWLNRVDDDWLGETVAGTSDAVFVLEDHAPQGALGDRILESLCRPPRVDFGNFSKLAVAGFPACGTAEEALRYHGLDSQSIASRILPAKKAAA